MAESDSAELEALFDSVAAARVEPAASAGSGDDSAELEALFDSVAAASLPEALAAVGDSAELEALFASTAAAVVEPADVATPEGVVAGGDCQRQVFEHIGHAARKLHDALQGMGLDGALNKAADAFPDARERLNYVASLTEQAANRVLNATDDAQPIVDALGSEASKLDARWQRILARDLPQSEFKPLVQDTREFLSAVPKRAADVSGHLTEIMMSQDFQDLTGQVIKRLLTMAQDIESTLVQLLVAAAPADRRQEMDASLLNGPVISADGRTDVVTSQEQVDDLLASLGF